MAAPQEQNCKTNSGKSFKYRGLGPEHVSINVEGEGRAAVAKLFLHIQDYRSRLPACRRFHSGEHLFDFSLAKIPPIHKHTGDFLRVGDRHPRSRVMSLALRLSF